jgi:prepilin-type N-terminal cleavage/methylation domain-containing protein
MLRKLSKENKGFTIIEVLIVLAIAGLIMLIVFLAVPALQRNARNTQRTSDASLFAAAVGECLSNKNGQQTSCDTNAELVLDTSKFSILKTHNAATNTFPANTDTLNWSYSAKCGADGASVVTAGASARQFAVLFLQETSSGTTNRCIDS